MLNYLKLLLFLFIYSFAQGQIDLEKNLFQLNEYNDKLTINEVVEKEKNGLFNSLLPLETYRNLKNKEANWVCINVTKQTKKQYISIENSLFEELNFYIYQKDNIEIPTNLQDKKEYRFPIITIFPEQTPCKVFIRTKDALSYRTEFLIKNYNESTYAIITQRDYTVIGAYVLSLLVLLISTCVLFIYKRQYAVLWYAAHLTLLAVEYLISTGTFSQWLIDNNFILKFGLDHVALFLSTMALSEFLRNFYPFNSKTQYCKKIYLAVSLSSLTGALFSIADGFLGNIYNVEIYAQNLLSLASLITLILHVILVYNKVIPIYLFIAFLLPVLGIFANLGNLKELFNNPNITYFIFQSVYLGILIEVLVIIFYIIKQSIDGELKAIGLEDENNKLKYNFQETLTKNQEKHQNALLSDVHDSFGGYIEALKLTLLNKKIKDKSVDIILDSFTKEYRLLLNSLYVPNVNTENFTSAIQEYCNKMNNVTDINISFNYTKETYIEIPQDIAKFIFKASSELTTNAIKYAKPNFIKVELILNPKNIFLKVSDDGIGFSTSNIRNSSYGLNGIKNRVSLFKGSMEIESIQGSIIKINIPIPETND